MRHNEDSDTSNTAPPGPIPAASAPREQRPQPASRKASIVLLCAVIFITPFTGNVLSAIGVFAPELLKWQWMHLITVISSPFVLYFYTVTRPAARPRSLEPKGRLADFLQGLLIVFLIFSCVGGLKIGLEWGSKSIVKNSLGRLEVFHVKTAISAVGIFNQIPILIGFVEGARQFLSRWNTADPMTTRLSEGEDGNDNHTQRSSPVWVIKLRRLGWRAPVGWCILHFLVGLFSYCLFFGAHKTYQPSWTRVLG